MKQIIKTTSDIYDSLSDEQLHELYEDMKASEQMDTGKDMYLYI